ncbi:MAG: homoserine dehydrogenase, partial [Acidobacteria bacterium]
MTMKQVRVGIVGFGTVGRATADIIVKHADLIAHRSGVRLVVTAVCRRSSVQPQDTPAGACAVADWRRLLKDPNVDVVVET